MNYLCRLESYTAHTRKKKLDTFVSVESSYQCSVNEQIQFGDSENGTMLLDIRSVFPLLDVDAWTRVHLILVRWQFKQIPHSFMDGCTLWLPGGAALGGLGRTVIFRPIKSGVQVCGIIHHPKGLATSSAITALSPTLKIAGRWNSHYNHPSLQWKTSDRARENKVCL